MSLDQALARERLPLASAPPTRFAMASAKESKLALVFSEDAFSDSTLPTRTLGRTKVRRLAQRPCIENVSIPVSVAPGTDNH
jgi:hypothetical protein